jgi:hypothetical protein
MEKTVTIDGRDVRLKSSAALPLRYKAQFGRDLFADMAKMDDVGDGKKKKVDLSALDTDAIFNVIWTLAKCADPSIPPVIDWVESFEEFPVFAIFKEAGPLITLSMGTSQKNVEAAAGK